MQPIKIRKFTVRNSKKTTKKQVKAVSEILFNSGILYKVSVGKVYITFTTQCLTDVDAWAISRKIKEAKKNI